MSTLYNDTTIDDAPEPDPEDAPFDSPDSPLRTWEGEPVRDEQGRVVAPAQTAPRPADRPAGPWDANGAPADELLDAPDDLIEIGSGDFPLHPFGQAPLPKRTPCVVAGVDIHKVPQRVWDVLEELCDEAMARHYDSRSEETLTECRLCDEWEGHKPGCPMPLVLALVK